MSLAKVFSKHRLEAVEKLKLTAKTLYPVGQKLRRRAGGGCGPSRPAAQRESEEAGLRSAWLWRKRPQVYRCLCPAAGVPLPVTTA